MRNLRKTQLIGICLTICLFASLFAVLFGASAFAETGRNEFGAYEVERITSEIFGDVRIKSIGYLYSLDSSPDFIYSEFEGYGYVIYLKETMEMLEYSLQSGLPYRNNVAHKYYGGPSNYLRKENERFVNDFSGETFAITSASSRAAAQLIRDAFSINGKAKDVTSKYKQPIDSELFDMSLNSSGTEVFRVKSSGNMTSVPVAASNPIIVPAGSVGSRYIANAQWFTANPTHGNNVHGTCSSVAAQLMLSYHNYNSDRRIIQPQHLNGGWHNNTGNDNIFDPVNYTTPANNSNASAFAFAPTRQTGGSNDDFYTLVIGAVEPSALSCVCTKTDIWVDGMGTTTITISITQGGTTTTTTTTRPSLPGEQSSLEETHTHEGANITNARNGLRTLLSQRFSNSNHYTVNSYTSAGAISPTNIRAEINAERPVYVTLRGSLGGTYDKKGGHAVVAYGYQDYTYPAGHANEGEIYDGYIVHYGWSGAWSYGINAWVNSGWCDGYLTMQINSHTHNYNTYIGGNNQEVRCSTCGHRENAYTFSTSGMPAGQIALTGVRTGIDITGTANIPEIYNGRTVTTIGESAFANQTQLSQIIIPASLVSIGSSVFFGCTSLESASLGGGIEHISDSAFAGCSNLNTVTFANNVKSIGNNAFNNCYNLTSISSIDNVQTIGYESFKGCNLLANIFLPDSLVSIGQKAFANCNNLSITVSPNNLKYSADSNVLYNKNKTILIAACDVSPNITILNSVSEILPYSFEGNSKLNTLHCYHNPIIGEYAFANCLNMNSVFYYSYDVPTAMGTDCFANNNFVLYTPYICQESYGILFASYTDDIDSIEITFSFISDDAVIGTIDVYYGSYIENLIEPIKTGYDFCGWFDNPIFEGTPIQNGELFNSKDDLILYANWTPKQFYIIFAGEQIENLEPMLVTYNAAIGVLPTVSKTGYTFLDWYDENGLNYKETSIWVNLNNIILTSDWSANEYIITFDGNGGAVDIETQIAVYNTIVSKLATCLCNGYTFYGWNTSADGSGQDINVPFVYLMDNDIILYAQWQIIEYSITYDLDGGIMENDNPLIYTILDNILLNNPHKKGYSFVGWMNGCMVTTSISVGSYGDLNLVAYWDANQYTITLDPNGGTNSGLNTLIATYNSSFSVLSFPTRIGYTFEGWYDSEYIKYITVYGESTRPWDKASDSTLYAHWAIKSYEIQINNIGSIIWLGPTGLSNVQCSIEYGTAMSAINLIAIFKQSNQGYKEGMIFDHFEYNGTFIDWQSIPDLGENGTIITIIPVWILEVHTIYFNTLFDTTVNEIEADYNANIQLPTNIDRPGYIFIGWYSSVIEGIKISWTKMPDLTLGNQNNGSTVLFARYTPLIYTITYNLDGGTNSLNNPSTYNIESEIYFSNATKVGYIFSGWFLDLNKTIQIIELKNNTENIELYAKWAPINYLIRYHNGVESIDDNHIYDIAKNLRANTFIKTGYTFAGWATSPDECIIYSNAQSVINLTNIHNAVIDLYIHWEANFYNIYYNPNGGSGTMNSSVHTYNIAKSLNPNTFTRAGYVFAGWANTTDGNVVYSNVQSVSNLTPVQGGNVELYAKWTYTVAFNVNNGMGSPSVASITVNAEGLGTLATVGSLSRSGYTFAGWNTNIAGTGASYTAGATYGNTTGNITLYAKWTYKVTFNVNGGAGSPSVTSITNPSGGSGNLAGQGTLSRSGYTFAGWNTNTAGTGTSYATGTAYSNSTGNITLYAKWTYTITFNTNGGTGTPSVISITNTSGGSVYLAAQGSLSKAGYNFKSWNTNSAGTGTDYYANASYNNTIGNIILYAKWDIRTLTFDVNFLCDATFISNSYNINLLGTEVKTISAPTISGYDFYKWEIMGSESLSRKKIVDFSTNSTINVSISDFDPVIGYINYSLRAQYTKKCVAEGTLITLADGTKKTVENLTGDEYLLVWNMITGSFDSAPILFIDSDPVSNCEIIHLYFDDGTEVKVISEHGFWDITLNSYVFLRNDASQYIGHWFNKQITDTNNNVTYTSVQLVDVQLYNEYTTAWSPVTFGHLCYYVNGMLSMPGATEGLINIFEVDAVTMQYDAASFAADIAAYGLFTYEEFAEIIPIPEIIFEAFNGQYLKVSIGKGLIDMEGLVALVERYADFFAEDMNTSNPQNNSNNNGHHNGHNNGNNNGHHNGSHSGHGNGNKNGYHSKCR